ncbi:phage associated-antirepressor BRO [Bifidobacterium actinocoloniiforme DSM 22766]|uniref:Phage associated-antirepressor BRO n=1 Tax=Bifidobacterium actinocoloniiforme DSM 22766 TaxID=1437605 RepID=A0A086Z1K2_9BIFI|nr:phage antirepressor KilAC domain-containing protein [Bifidobacterium actinocoloniiforme]AKV55535.1 hypothetical protein AB656_04125 [Bifidobacterium actinocoloniiforme DSM 22766]KFI40402.1 phage associated-antirepressor BRO [Bifidobacterium actinocoloniiforme DSM 22766]
MSSTTVTPRPFVFEGHSVRTLTFETGLTWWVLSDVAKALEVQNASDLAKRLDEDERSRFNLGRQGEAWIVNESGLYKIILRSDKPEAKRFQRWVTHEVLPQIRRTGGYIPKAESPEETMARAVLIAQKTIEEQEGRIAELAPKADALDLLTSAEGSYSVAEAAKLLSEAGGVVRVKDLYSWLGSHAWAYMRDGHWVANQERVNAGHLEMRAYKTTGTHRDGTSFAFHPQLRVTAKGLGLIARRISEERLNTARSNAVEVAA